MTRHDIQTFQTGEKEEKEEKKKLELSNSTKSQL